MGRTFHAYHFLLGLGIAFTPLLGGCQSSTGPEALTSVDSNEVGRSAAPSATMAVQTFGDGPTRVDMFIDASVANHADDYRDGAALAMKELGAGQITLTVRDLRAQAMEPASQIKQSIDSGAKLLIGPSSLAKAFDGAAEPATLFLDEQPTASGVAIASDEIGGAIEVASYAAGAGRSKIMVVSTRMLTPFEMQRLQTGLKNAGVQLLNVVTDPTSPDGLAKLARLGEAQAVLLIGVDAPKVAAPALRQRGGLAPDVPFLGTFAWSDTVHQEPVLEGSLLALIDQNALKRISERFRTAYGRPLSLEAAYGFDALAVAAGIVRTKGSVGLNAQALRSSSGFAGATGIFRFDVDGWIERRLAIYRLSRGKLVLQDDAPSGF